MGRLGKEGGGDAVALLPLVFFLLSHRQRSKVLSLPRIALLFLCFFSLCLSFRLVVCASLALPQILASNLFPSPPSVTKSKDMACLFFCGGIFIVTRGTRHEPLREKKKKKRRKRLRQHCSWLPTSRLAFADTRIRVQVQDAFRAEQGPRLKSQSQMAIFEADKQHKKAHP